MNRNKISWQLHLNALFRNNLKKTLVIKCLTAKEFFSIFGSFRLLNWDWIRRGRRKENNDRWEIENPQFNSLLLLLYSFKADPIKEARPNDRQKKRTSFFHYLPTFFPPKSRTSIKVNYQQGNFIRYLKTESFFLFVGRKISLFDAQEMYFSWFPQSFSLEVEIQEEINRRVSTFFLHFWQQSLPPKNGSFPCTHFWLPVNIPFCENVSLLFGKNWGTTWAIT